MPFLVLGLIIIGDKMKKMILNIIPIIFQLLFFPLWYLDCNWFGADGIWSLIEFAVNMLIVPVYLVAVNSIQFKINLKSILINIIYMILISIASTGLHFLKWWLSGAWIGTTRIGGIDSITIALTQFEMLFSVVFISVLWLLVNGIRFLIIEKRKNKGAILWSCIRQHL